MFKKNGKVNKKCNQLLILYERLKYLTSIDIIWNATARNKIYELFFHLYFLKNRQKNIIYILKENVYV